MSPEELLIDLIEKKAELAEKRARLYAMEEITKVRLQAIEDMKAIQLQHIEELKAVRLKSNQDTCQLLENQLDIINLATRLCRRQVGTSRVKPVWNPATGELWYAGNLIKKFAKPAPNQRFLLDCFRRLRFRNPVPNPWLEPACITSDVLETLKNTVDGLNEDHITPNLLRFGWQGDGMKAYWQAIASDILPSEPG